MKLFCIVPQADIFTVLYNDLWLGKTARGIIMTLITILRTGPWPLIRVAFTSKGAIKANIVSLTTVNWTVDLITRIWSVGGCNFRGWAQPWLELSEGQSEGGGDPGGEIYSTLPNVTRYYCSLSSHLLFCCPVQTCHSDCSRRGGGSDGRMKGRGQQEEVVCFACLANIKVKADL